MLNSSTTVLQGWTPESGGRGTWSIIWSCLSTTFICLWVAFHPNVPAPTDNRWHILLRRLQWVALGVLIPEWVAYTAVDQWASARYYRNKLQALGYKCSLMQTFHACMGGFYLVCPDDERTYALGVHQLFNLLEEGKIQLPTKQGSNSTEWLVSDKDIQDRSKADELVKAVAVTHVLWFAIQYIARAARGLPISLLEVTTAGYVFCGMLSYCFWWSKPYNVQIGTKLEAKGEFPRDTFNTDITDRVTNDLSEDMNTHTIVSIRYRESSIYFCVLMLGLGAIHVAAWDFSFPSDPEGVCWKVAAVTTAAWSLLYMFYILLNDYE